MSPDSQVEMPSDPTQIEATKVLFPLGIYQREATIVLTGQDDHSHWCVTDCTPFHPVSHIWPDHPADRGVISTPTCSTTVVDCVVGAWSMTEHRIEIGNAITARRDDTDWQFVVVHRTDNPLNVGQAVSMQVDAAYQDSLSRGHTAGHLASMALNRVLEQHNYWRKQADRRDPLGAADFNSYAQASSVVTVDRCEDLYRIGKTLKKRGLNAADVLQNLSSIATLANQQLQKWLSNPVKVTMRCEGDTLTSSRYWECGLENEICAVMPCGGTHVRHLSVYRNINITLSQRDEQHIIMVTDVEPADAARLD